MQIHIPTQLTEKRNLKFRQLYKKHFDEELSIADADKEAYRLLSFFAIIIENTSKYHKD